MSKKFRYKTISTEQFVRGDYKDPIQAPNPVRQGFKYGFMWATAIYGIVAVIILILNKVA